MNRIQQLFGIQHPIIQAGMIWCSGWELASAVSNAGGLGIIGAGLHVSGSVARSNQEVPSCHQSSHLR
jgi:NAD(P)H-dependent flavin oxidoreductase YrpB (nitropropane dioxygenase family)